MQFEARILIDVMGTERYAAPCDEGSPPGKLRAELPEALLWLLSIPIINTTIIMTS